MSDIEPNIIEKMNRIESRLDEIEERLKRIENMLGQSPFRPGRPMPPGPMPPGPGPRPEPFRF